jgi:hypothetical protein
MTTLTAPADDRGSHNTYSCNHDVRGSETKEVTAADPTGK